VEAIVNHADIPVLSIDFAEDIEVVNSTELMRDEAV